MSAKLYAAEFCLPGHPDKLILNQPVLSPDGKRVAFTVNEDPPTDEDGNLRRHVFVRPTAGKGPGFKVAINAMSRARLVAITGGGTVAANAVS